jgi:hypothetical protein
MELQQWFQHHGKLLPKERNYLNDWNEWVAKSKLDDLRADYFTKQKRRRVEEQGIFATMIRKEGRDSGAKSGK